jgi:hypothetical protein
VYNDITGTLDLNPDTNTGGVGTLDTPRMDPNTLQTPVDVAAAWQNRYFAYGARNSGPRVLEIKPRELNIMATVNRSQRLVAGSQQNQERMVYGDATAKLIGARMKIN